jgi:hypothetical protein
VIRSQAALTAAFGKRQQLDLSVPSEGQECLLVAHVARPRLALGAARLHRQPYFNRSHLTSISTLLLGHDLRRLAAKELEQHGTCCIERFLISAVQEFASHEGWCWLAPME